MGSQVFDRLLWSITHDSLTLSRWASSADVSTSNDAVEPEYMLVITGVRFVSEFQCKETGGYDFGNTSGTYAEYNPSATAAWLRERSVGARRLVTC